MQSLKSLGAMEWLEVNHMCQFRWQASRSGYRGDVSEFCHDRKSDLFPVLAGNEFILTDFKIVFLLHYFWSFILISNHNVAQCKQDLLKTDKLYFLKSKAQTSQAVTAG